MARRRTRREYYFKTISSIVVFVKPKDIIHAILKIPYILAYAKVKFFSRVLWGIKVWPRHSYLTEAFIPFKSDLEQIQNQSHFF